MEHITRTRRTPGGYDLNGDRVPSSEDHKTIRVRAVAPGTSKTYTGDGRDGEDIAFTIYCTRPVDIKDDDRLEIRGRTYHARVAEWVSPFGTGRRGTVIEATRETG